MFLKTLRKISLTNICRINEKGYMRNTTNFLFTKKESIYLRREIKEQAFFGRFSSYNVVTEWTKRCFINNAFMNKWNVQNNAYNKVQIGCFSTKNIRGRLFYKRRPKQIPKLKKKNWRSKWLEGAPQKKGICLKVRVQTPKKPNSGLKKIARVRLSTGRIVCVYIPGIGHNLNTHSIILVRGGRCKDIPGCNYKAIRGVYDLLPVKNRFRKRSKYGVKLSEEKRKHLVERLNFKPITIKKDIEEFNKYKWFNYVDKDKNLREKPLEPDEPVPVNMFHFNTYYRNKKLQQSGKE